MPFITIWHHDPEKDGTDDSCGWFIRPRHADQRVLEQIKREFAFNFKHNYWFDEQGKQVFSTIGTLMLMYREAAWIHFKRNREKVDAFMRKHTHAIILFAENPIDCGGNNITNKFKGDPLSPDRFNHFAGMVYSDILRKEQKWYQHPRWHVHHWKIQFHPWEQFVRRFWSKCSVCGKRGFKGSAHGDNSGKIWHSECDHLKRKVVENGR